MTEIIIIIQFIFIFLITFTLLYPALIKNKYAPIHDIYFFWIAVFFLYTFIPPFLLFNGISSYEEFHRMSKLDPTNNEIRIYLSYVLCILSGILVFHFFYLKRIQSSFGKVISLTDRVPKMSIFLSLVMLFISFFLIEILEAFFGPQSQTRLESYLLIREMPSWYRQVIKLLYNINFVLQIILIISLFQRFRRNNKLLFIISGAYIFYLLMNISDGGRAEFFAGFLSIFLIWHFCVNNLNKSLFFLSALIALLVLVAFGIIRDSYISGTFSIGELDSIFANSIDLIRFYELGNMFNLNLITHVSDLTDSIPSQIAPYEKTTHSIWFMQKFHPLYYEVGGGYGFGIINQAIVGFGYTHAFLFGIFIAFILNYLNTFSLNCNKYWKLVVFIFIFLNIHNTIRATFFIYFSALVQAVIPILLILWIGNKLISDSSDEKIKISNDIK